MVSAMCFSLPASTTGRPPAAGSASSTENIQAVTPMAANPFAGQYCGNLGTLRIGITIDSRGRVSGSAYGYGAPPLYAYRMSFDGRVSANGVMQLNVVANVSGRGGRSPNNYITAVVTVALDENGVLVGSWQYVGAAPSPFRGTVPFAIPPCQ